MVERERNGRSGSIGGRRAGSSQQRGACRPERSLRSVHKLCENRIVDPSCQPSVFLKRKSSEGTITTSSRIQVNVLTLRISLNSHS